MQHIEGNYSVALLVLCWEVNCEEQGDNRGGRRLFLLLLFCFTFILICLGVSDLSSDHFYGPFGIYFLLSAWHNFMSSIPCIKVIYSCINQQMHTCEVVIRVFYS